MQYLSDQHKIKGDFTLITVLEVNQQRHQVCVPAGVLDGPTWGASSKFQDFRIFCGGKIIPCPVFCTLSVCCLLPEMPSALVEILSSYQMFVSVSQAHMGWWGLRVSLRPPNSARGVTVLGSVPNSVFNKQKKEKEKKKQLFSSAKNWQKWEGWTSFNGKGRVDNIFLSGTGRVKRPLQIANTLFHH